MKKSEIVSFRVSRVTKERFKAYCEARNISPQKFLHEAVLRAVDGIDESEERNLLEEILAVVKEQDGSTGEDAFRGEMYGLRVDLSTLARVLLVRSGLQEAEATAWVRHNMLRR